MIASGNTWLNGVSILSRDRYPILRKGPKSDIVLYSTVSLYRSLDTVPFKATQDESSRRELRAFAERCRGSFADDADRYLDSSKRSDPQLAAYFSTGMADADAQAGYILAPGRDFCVSFNAAEHLRITVQRAGLSVSKCVREAGAYDERLNANARYAFNATFGHLTGVIQHSGTGMAAGCTMHLPVLTLLGTVPEIQKRLQKSGVSLEPLFAGSAAAHGSIYRLMNLYSFGITEAELERQLTDIAETITKMESEAREEYCFENAESMRDSVLRSLGTAERALFLDHAEALDIVSRLRLGIILSFIKGPMKRAGESLLTLSREMLEIEHGAPFSGGREADRYRADHLRTTLLEHCDVV